MTAFSRQVLFLSLFSLISFYHTAAASAGEYVPKSGQPGKDVVWVPSPSAMVEKLLDMAALTPQDFVIDLGSGDGRIVLRAAEKFGARAVGVEIDHGLAVESTEKTKEMKLDKLVTIIEGDLFQTDIRPATVVTIYLLLSTNDRLRPLMEKDLRPGTRVVAHDIRIPGWEAAREETFKVGTVLHVVYLYEIPGAFRKPAVP